MDEVSEAGLIAERSAYLGRERTLKTVAVSLFLLAAVVLWQLIVVSSASYLGLLPNQPANPPSLILGILAAASLLVAAFACYQLWRLKRSGLIALLGTAFCALMAVLGTLAFASDAAFAPNADFGYVAYVTVHSRVLASVFFLLAAAIVWLALAKKTRRVLSPQGALLREKTPSVSNRVGEGTRLFLSLAVCLAFLVMLACTAQITEPTMVKQPADPGHFVVPVSHTSPVVVQEENHYGETDLPKGFLDGFSPTSP